MRIGKKDLAAGVVFLALMAGFILLVNSLTATSGEQETRLVYDAVKNSALTSERTKLSSIRSSSKYFL